MLALVGAEFSVGNLLTCWWAFSSTRMATASNSWVDDYLDWLSGNGCCFVKEDGSFCPSTEYWRCKPCERHWMEDGLRPTPETFDRYLVNFLSDLPHDACPKAGRAAYANVSGIYIAIL